MKNLDLLNSLATTNYSDWKGVISIDQYDIPGAIQELCSKNGIDENQFFIAGFGINDGEGMGNPTLNVLLIDKEKYGYSMQDVIDKANAGDDIKVSKKSFRISYKELSKAFKRLSFMTIWKGVQGFEIAKD